MDDYAGRVLADRYRLPLPPPDAYETESAETRAFDTYSGQEVRIRQVPLPEIVDAELLDDRPYAEPGRATRRPADPTVRRAVEAAQAAARIPDHPRLDQVFDVFAEAGSLWIVSEFVAAVPLSELLAEGPLSPYRAAEMGADLLTALRALHAHGWTHRNVTARTVLVCDDGRVVLTGLAAGAAEEALCGYAPVPDEEEPDDFPVYPETPEPYAYEAEAEAHEAGPESYETEAYDPYETEAYEEFGGATVLPPAREPEEGDPDEAYPDEAYLAGTAPDEAYLDEPGRAPDAYEGDDQDPDEDPEAPGATGYGPHGGTPYGPGRAVRPELPPASVVPAPAVPPAGDLRQARAGAIAAYRAGARAAARIGETGALPAQRPAEPEQPEQSEQSTEPAGPPAGPPAPPEPQWWTRVGEDDDDDGDDDETGGTYGRTPPPRAYLKGNWTDGPHASRDGGRSLPAGGGSALPALPAGYRAATPEPAAVPAGPSEPGAGRVADAYRGPATRLAAERARQTRMAVVGAVTERWAPEQAGPVHEHWRLAPPIGPATDLWALGALLYRAVQGHAPYPEDSAAELVQLVCAEPPAFAEECGPLRPVVESLLRQDPTERPDVEELSGWLRSLVRSAPEPEAGLGVVPLPSPDATRLPIIRRRGELVRRRRGGAGGGRHRHRQAKGRTGRDMPYSAHPAHQATAHASTAYAAYPDEAAHEEIPQRASRAPRDPGRPSGSPRSLGRTLLLLILLLLAGAVAYAVWFLPKSGEQTDGSGAPPAKSGTPAGPSAPPADGGDRPTAGTTTAPTPTKPATATPPAVDPSAPSLRAGYELRKDPEGFQIGVVRGWRRSPINDAGQVRFTGGDFTLIVVPGRDTVAANGADPLAYQRTKERELQPWRDSSWSGASGLRRIDIGTQAMAVGQFTWQDSTGREVFVRNLALIQGGSYHIVQVIGPENERDKVSEIYDQAVKAYRATR
ncbi:protein kinase [Streptomyces sp. SKN60]|uniref:protein kinase n=1 Tax=Streptomyces sp. SKN60 TaxID=2855506 RepID=UPI0022482634|nr:protein kinase [Streptomyces sp. SKN60]MCX2184402.1 protein kinase [Streptomyces sp. SKN60]